MKMRFPRLSLTLAILWLFSPLAEADTNIKISGEQAKQLYNSLTGPSVQNEGAAGHNYRIGKALSCRYTTVDMDDKQGKPLPKEDARRYYCGMKVNHEGFISISSNF